MTSLVHHFSRDEKSRHSEWLRQRKWFIKAREDRERREQVAEKAADDLTAFGTEAVMATEIQIRKFEAKLDTYDAATVTALLENQEQLDLVKAQIQEILSRAYVMEDGRRVFKTEDGTKVFDERGQEVSRDELDYDLIGDDRPSWEEYSQKTQHLDRLTKERQQLHDYQAQLDDAREKVANGEMTQAELEELETKIEEDAPNAVKSQVSPDALSADELDLIDSFESPARAPVKENNNVVASPPTLNV